MRPVGPAMAFCLFAAVSASCGGDGPTETLQPQQPKVVLSIMPSDEIQMVQTGWPNTPVSFSATLSGSSETINWTVGGTFVGSGPSITVELPVGSHSVCAEAGTKKVCNSVTIRKNEVKIQVYLASGDKPELPVDGLKICRFIMLGTRDYCADVPSDGKVSLSAPFLNDSSFMLVIEGGSTFPFLLTLNKSDYDKTVQAIVIEKEWKLTKGAYAGNSVPISLELAYKHTSILTSPSFFAGWVIDSVLEYVFNTFDKKNYPIPVILERDSSEYKFTPADSVAIWISIRLFESTLGETMFRPEESGSQWNVCNSILVYVEEERLGMAAGGARCDFGNLNTITGGLFILGGNVPGEHLLSKYFGVDHEFGHILGFGHTCSWKTTMKTGCDNSLNSDKFTISDVAYKEVMYRVEDLRRKYPGSYRIPESHQGERVVTLGMAPQPYKVAY